MRRLDLSALLEAMPSKLSPTTHTLTLSFRLWLPRLVLESFFFMTCEKRFIPAPVTRIDPFRYNLGSFGFLVKGPFVSELSGCVIAFIRAEQLRVSLRLQYAAARDALFYLAIGFILPKLYINSFLAISSLARLNRRQEDQVNKSLTHVEETSFENINIPLKEMQRVHLSDELDQPKRVLTCEV
ncbi:hypothetical protein IW262DRAFT_1300787 [Armillaria fumosa]|nr:hypothetical protein IW262DRAFT_1300787 [Armillaria fumosa]